MDIIAFSEPFLILIALIALGVLVARLHILDEQSVSRISNLVIQVTLPAAIFIAVATEMTPQMFGAAPWVVLLGVISGIVTYALAALIGRFLRLEPSRRGVYTLAACSTNTGFLGIPLIASVFGPVAAVTAVLYDFSTTIIIFTIGIGGLDRSDKRFDLWKLLRNLCNPMFMALVLAVGWSATGWTLPSLAVRLLHLLGDSTIPLVMICLGHMLYSAQGKARVPALHMGLLSGIRFIAAPMLMLALVSLPAMTPEAQAVCVLQSAMPAATLTPILARQYGADEHFGVSATLSTTLLSLLILPLLTYGLRWFYGLG